VVPGVAHGVGDRRRAVPCLIVRATMAYRSTRQGIETALNITRGAVVLPTVPDDVRQSNRRGEHAMDTAKSTLPPCSVTNGTCPDDAYGFPSVCNAGTKLLVSVRDSDIRLPSPIRDDGGADCWRHSHAFKSDVSGCLTRLLDLAYVQLRKA
jgi:hypothetical protein